MTHAAQSTRIADASLPPQWGGELASRLAPGEQVLAWLETDLDQNLRYAPGLLALTQRRLLSGASDRAAWHDWPIGPAQSLELSDHAGVATLKLFDADGRCIAAWRFTLGQHAAAQRLADRFVQLGDRRGVPVRQAPVLACPRCRAPLASAGAPCAQCGDEVADADAAVDAGEPGTPPSTRTLFRLWRFARPYRRQLLAGFLLTLASTAATLVPPYMTMPLMDDVLIPFQNGK
ncbi:MAG: ABC transporter, partial [Burkholderiaceae bacterium]|nr:ABC transporter [Burkholderiaceae bacterium]